jgi:carboxylate-amine ligase
MIYLLALKFCQEFEKNGKNPRLERWILAENKWRAARYGIQGEIILNKRGTTRKLKEALEELYEELLEFSNTPAYEETRPYLSVIPEIINKGSSSFRQREWTRHRPGDYKYIINNLLEETRKNEFLELTH